MSLQVENIISPLSDAEIQKIESEVSHLPDRQAAAVDALKIVQAHRGWISDESLAAIARQLDMSIEELDAIATFYNLIFRKPVGDRVILFCDSVSCWIMGGDKVCSRIKQKLGIDMGETSADNRYTLLPITCLGDCDHAPVMMVGEDLHRDLTPDLIDDIFTDGKG
ncbi:MAG: NADH-quinone oxidoreductase subunit NuoE [Pseudomonadales bacterium]